MRRSVFALVSLLATAGSGVVRAEQLIPAGSLIQCTVSEPKISSKTTSIGDPVLCRVSHVEMYGRSVMPYGTYLVGRFEDFKDPGHLVGKGWMELKFDRMIVQPDAVVPVEARVVNVPGYAVDRQGKILGKGHPVRDIVEWSIPLLWPIDLLNLPRRGPRPVLKEETKLTLKIMDDIGIPLPDRQRDEQNLQRRLPSAYAPAAESYAPPAPAPVVQAYAPPAPAPVVQVYVQQAPAPVVQAYAPPAPVVVPYPAPVAMVPGPYGYYGPAPVVQPYGVGYGRVARAPMLRQGPYGPVYQ